MRKLPLVPVLGWTLCSSVVALGGCRTTGYETPGKAWVGVALEPSHATSGSAEAAPAKADPAGESSDAGARCDQQPGRLFPPGATFNTPVTDRPLDSDSAAIINHLNTQHTTQQRFQIDFSLQVLMADARTPRRSFVPTQDFFTPDCDSAMVPLPPRGALEAETDYRCSRDGDCHLLVIDSSKCLLFEMWRANIQDEAFHGGCLAVWDLRRAYPAEQRGDQCTSADAAGLPITPLLVTPAEVQSGEIRHALRFILPNQHIRRGTYVRPATHSTAATSGPAESPPYGARLRLKASADLARFTPGAKVVARALQRYGMILADAGEVTFTATSDAYSSLGWGQVGLGPHDLKPLSWSEFEVVDGGARYQFSASCARTPAAR